MALDVLADEEGPEFVAGSMKCPACGTMHAFLVGGLSNESVHDRR